MRVVEILEYDGSWPALFEAECAVLRGVLGDVAVAIHHIGSTAVPGLAAKPVIDILVEVGNLDLLDALNDRMLSIGYEAKGEYGIPGRRYFPKGGDCRTHHLHAFASGDFGLHRHLAVRDYLCCHADVAVEYAQVKRAAAAKCGNDLEKYCDAKDAYVKRLESVALNAKRPNKAPEPTPTAVTPRAMK
jgi:GrpB-like predicted nucleotidyltransferase (UPF0157 family)